LIEATTEFFGFGVASLIRPTLGNLIAEATSSGIGGYSDLGLGWWVWTAPVTSSFCCSSASTSWATGSTKPSTPGHREADPLDSTRAAYAEPPGPDGSATEHAPTT
jgi:hypothetical protein